MTIPEPKTPEQQVWLQLIKTVMDERDTYAAQASTLRLAVRDAHDLLANGVEEGADIIFSADEIDVLRDTLADLL